MAFRLWDLVNILLLKRKGGLCFTDTLAAGGHQRSLQLILHHFHSIDSRRRNVKPA